MAAGDVATVFLEMSLGTRLAVSFPAPSTTVADLKRRVSHEHAACFPHLGQIAVQSIKIEHGGSWFHLADSMAVRDAFLFQGINERWHLQVDASPQVDQGMVTQQGHRSSNGAEQDREQGAWGRRLRPRTQAGKTPITLSSGSSSESEEMDTNTVGGGSSSSSESEEMDNNTVDAPAPQFVVELKKCHFVKQNGQYLNVPMEFGVVHRYTEKKKVLLRMGGESWAVNLKHGLTPTGRPRTSLRYGWQQFRVDNRLRVGETCFFRALPGDDDGDHHVLKVEVRRLDGSYAT
uniref:TF-B3 domain-containing protein n=1 Tax=Aegilops tauschii subsp. strangulata TaxID=200361 RepID=A0A453LAX4_AEGTS